MARVIVTCVLTVLQSSLLALMVYKRSWHAVVIAGVGVLMMLIIVNAVVNKEIK